VNARSEREPSIEIELRPVPAGIKWTASHPTLTSLVHTGVESTWPEAMARAMLTVAQWDVGDGLFESRKQGDP
jgi:hypothetical protein